MTTTHVVKGIIIGQSKVGKSSIMRHYTEEIFPTIHDTTIGIEFGAKLIRFKDHIIKLQIWDTAGQEAFRTITRSYYRDASIVFIVFDLNDRDSYESLPSWVSDVCKYCIKNKKIIYFIGNKKDLFRKVPSEEEILHEISKYNLTAPDGSKYGFKYFEITARERNELCNIFTQSVHDLFTTYPDLEYEHRLQISYPLLAKRGYSQMDGSTKKCRC